MVFGATLPVRFVVFERRTGETNRQQARRWRKLHGTHEWASRRGRQFASLLSRRNRSRALVHPLWARECFFDQLRMLGFDLAGKGMEGYMRDLAVI